MNLTLAFLLSQNLGPVENNDWAINIITKLTNKYFNGKGDVFVFHYFDDESEDILLEGALKQLNNRGDFLLSYYNGTDGIDPPDFLKPKGIVLFIDFSKKTYSQIISDFLMSILKNLHSDLRLIVVLHHTKYIRVGDMMYLLEKCWRINLRNVILANPVSSDTALVDVKLFYWRHDFDFRKHSEIDANNIKRVTISKTDSPSKIDEIIRYNEMFTLVDVTDIKGHFLNVSVAVTPPYVWLTTERLNFTGKEKVNLTTDELDGIEVSIVKEFQRKYNLSGYFIIHPSEIISIKELADETSQEYGVLEETAVGISDIAIGGSVPTADIYSFFVSSAVYFEDDMHLFVAGPRQVPRWKNLYLIFKNNIWYCIAVTHILLSVTAFIFIRSNFRFKSKTDFSTVMLTVWATELSQPLPPKVPDLMRALFTAMILYGMHISNFYQSGLVTVLHERFYETPIRTLEEAKSANMKICLSGISYDFFFSQNLSHELSSNTDYTIHLNYTKCLDLVVELRDHMTLVPEKTTDYTVPLRYLDENYVTTLQKIRKRILRYPVSMYLTKASPYKTGLNFVINGLLESGIIGHWWHDMKYSKRYRKIILRRNTFADHGYSSISLSNATGVFFITLLSLGISFIVFVFEIVWFKYKTWKANRKTKPSNKDYGSRAKIRRTFF